MAFEDIQKPGYHKHRSFKDALVLGPIDKYVKFNQFPFKFIVHLSLLMLTAWLVLLQIIPQTSYTADMEMTLN